MTTAVLRDKIKETMNCIVSCPNNQSTIRQVSKLNPFLVMGYPVPPPKFCGREIYNKTPSPPSRYVHNHRSTIPDMNAADSSETPVPLCQFSGVTLEKTATLEFILFFGTQQSKLGSLNTFLHHGRDHSKYCVCY